jgi:hypothetical protein
MVLKGHGFSRANDTLREVSVLAGVGMQLTSSGVAGREDYTASRRVFSSCNRSAKKTLSSDW